MLQKIKKLHLATEGQLFLVNHDGYFFNNSDSELNWGFMLDKQEHSLAQQHPQFWKELVENGGFQKLLKDQNLFLGSAICLAQSCNNTNQKYSVDTLIDKRHWYLINQHPTPAWWQLNANTWASLLLIMLLLLAVITRRSFNDKQAISQDLKDDPANFLPLLKALPTGACIIDKQGQVQIYNQGFANVFNLQDRSSRKNNFYDLFPSSIRENLTLKVYNAITDNNTQTLYDKQQPLQLLLAHKAPLYFSLHIAPLKVGNREPQSYLLLMENLTIELHKLKQNQLSISLQTISELSNELLNQTTIPPEAIVQHLQMCASQVDLSKHQQKLRPLLQQWQEQLQQSEKPPLEIEMILTDDCQLNLDQANFNRFMELLLSTMPESCDKLTLPSKRISIKNSGEMLNLYHLEKGDYVQIALKGCRYKKTQKLDSNNSDQDTLEPFNGCEMHSGDYLPLGSAFGLVKQCNGAMRIKCSENNRTIFIYLPVFTDD
ncbi:hypothetical protein THIOSC13_520001 [uncultured Thiomicrorhabdus sp.]